MHDRHWLLTHTLVPEQVPQLTVLLQPGAEPHVNPYVAQTAPVQPQ
jgi:hypothetical protein